MMTKNEMPVEIWVKHAQCGNKSKGERLSATENNNSGDRTKYIREDIAMSEYCGYKNATMAMFNGHVPSMKEAAVGMVRADQQPAQGAEVVEVSVEEFNNIIDPHMPSFRNVGNMLAKKYAGKLVRILGEG